MSYKSTATKSKKLPERMSARNRACVYLLHRYFKGNISLFVVDMQIPDVTKEVLTEWNEVLEDTIIAQINKENAAFTGPDTEEIPTIKGIKEKIIKRVNALVNSTDNPVSLMQSYKILSEFESTDEKRKKSVADAVKESMQTLSDSAEDATTMLDKLRAEGKAPLPVPGKRKRGRPRKIQPTPQLYDNPED